MSALDIFMENVLTRKLQGFAPLSADSQRLLDDVIKPSRNVKARTDLIAEGEASESVRLILEGLACRYKTLGSGQRQIAAYLIPGDFCDLHAFVLKEMDHSIATVSACTLVDIPRHRIMELTERPDIARAFWWVTLVDEGTLREWLLNVGQRPATQRIAHLFCELYVRLQAAGLPTEGGYDLPLVQTDIADTAGLSPVHVNRCLQQLRKEGLVNFVNKSIVIADIKRLMRFCNFNANYLHLANGRYVH